MKSFLYNYIKETEKAICLDIIDFNGSIVKFSLWLPKSSIKIVSREKVLINDWIAKEKNI